MTAHAVANWFGDSPLVFSSASDVLFCCAEHRVLCFAVPSGDYLCDLVGHTENVTGIVLNPAVEEQLLSCSRDKTIKIWDYLEGVCVKTINLGVIPLQITAGTFKKAKREGKKLAYCRVESLDTGFEVLAVNVDSGKIKTRYKKLYFCYDIAASPSGEYVAVAARCYIKIAGCSAKQRYEIFRRGFVNRVAFHPSRKTIALADRYGNIALWKDFHRNDRKGSGKDKLTGNQLHWHSHLIGSMKFTQDGGYLLSVGEESVLVTWQLETLNRQFLPRIGGHLTHLAISPNDKWIAVGDLWNAIRLVDPISNAVARSITGMYSLRSSHIWHMRHIPDPGSPGTILCTAQPGTLQCFDLLHMRSTGAIEVAPRNIISRTRKEIMEYEYVDKADVRADGQVMATISVFKSNSLLAINGNDFLSYTLRFWKRNADGRCWQLVTEVKQPHRGPITCLRMCALHSLALTCGGNDGTFKIWTAYETRLAPTPKALKKRQNVEADAQSKEMWKCSGVGTFGSAQEFVSGDISSNGSCLAVATKTSISLWEISPSLKRRRIINLGQKDIVHTVRFLPRRPLLLLIRTRCHVALIDINRTDNVDPKVMWTFPATTPLSPDVEEGDNIGDKSPSTEEQKQEEEEIIDVAIHPLLPRVLIASRKPSSTSTQLEVMGPEGPLRQPIELDQQLAIYSLSFVELPEDGTTYQAGRLSAVYTARKSAEGPGTLFMIKDLLVGAKPILAEEGDVKPDATAGVLESLRELKRKKRKKKKKRKLEKLAEKSKKAKKL